MPFFPIIALHITLPLASLAIHQIIEKTQEISIDKAGFHTPVDITSIVKSYNINDTAMAGKFGLRIYESHQLGNASAKNAVPSNMEPIIEYLFEYKLLFT